MPKCGGANRIPESFYFNEAYNPGYPSIPSAILSPVILGSKATDNAISPNINPARIIQSLLHPAPVLISPTLLQARHRGG